jgi:hypothetical protein
MPRKSSNGTAVLERQHKNVLTQKVSETTRNSEVVIRKPSQESIYLTLKGTTSLLANRFSDKAMQALYNMDHNVQAGEHPVRNEFKEFLESRYMIQPGTPVKMEEAAAVAKGMVTTDKDAGMWINPADGVHGFPAIGIKEAMVRGSKGMPGLPMTDARLQFFVLPGKMHDDLIPVAFKRINMRQDIVRLNNAARSPQLRYRAEYIDWTMQVKILFRSEQIQLQTVLDIIGRAGYVGLGDWRPECSGVHGMFEIDADSLKAESQSK